ncbi:hypothetical protein C3L33_03613, partial [Rhododendron williamsianum]
MAYIYSNGEISNIGATVCSNELRNGSLLSNQLDFCSSMDDIFARLLTLTSYISGRFVRFIEELIYRDINRCSDDVLDIPYGQPSRSSSCSCCSSSSPRPCIGILDKIASDLKKKLPVNSTFEIVERDSSLRGINFIFRGLMLPLFGLRLALRLALASCKISLCYVRCAQLQICGKTLHGSTDDIGWLQHTPGMAPVEDGSARFLELLQRVRLLDSHIYLTCQFIDHKSRVVWLLRNGNHNLPDSFVYLLIPGLFSNHGPLYFVSTKKFFSKMGLACHIAKIHSEASVEHNAWELKQYIEELYWGSGKRVMLLGHSKGGVDAAAALSLYCDDLKDKVAGLALVQSPYGGTPLASDILREGQIADKETRRIMELLICKIIKVIEVAGSILVGPIILPGRDSYWRGIHALSVFTIFFHLFLLCLSIFTS